ncbi:hypothetical protein EOT00_06535 [Listeria seeligeri]|uniref:hypothetical protein n=1 Tax=Listeria seeligeri TaxID=1640 RepID=UPI0011188737|nr:hypothetical protein [Listeria seeligeri]QDA74614.1 hypothetical protein EOT00_06535 [Listeria seeligeri]
MKIVLNKCFGGFGLSHKAELHLYELKGINVYAYLSVRMGDVFSFERVDKSYNPKLKVWEDIWYLEKELPKLEFHINEDWECIKQIELISDMRDSKNRIDPDLIATVELLGDASNAAYANLKIVEIPDESNFIIKEYDGMETAVYGFDLGEV